MRNYKISNTLKKGDDSKMENEQHAKMERFVVYIFSVQEGWNVKCHFCDQMVREWGVI